MELDFGEWEGRAWDEITRRDRERFEAWSANWQWAAPPGGESAVKLQERIESFLADLPSERVLVVTHAGPIRALRVVLTGCSWSDAMAEVVQYCAPLAIAAPQACASA
jgi:alpha-ribazole phosphatase